MIPVKMFVRLMNDNYGNAERNIHEIDLKIILTHYVDIQFSDGTPCRVKYVHMPDDTSAIFFLDSPHFCYYTKVIEIESAINFDAEKIGQRPEDYGRLSFQLKNMGRIIIKELSTPDFDYTVYDGTDRTDAEDMIMRFILENDL